MTRINFPEDPSLPKELILSGDDPKEWGLEIEKWAKEVSVSVEELLRRVRVDLTALGTISGTPSTVEIGDAAAVGSVGTPADVGHIHAVGDPVAPPALTNPQTAAEGTSVVPMRSDAKAGIPTPATPSTQAFGDSATSGVGTGFAVDTHKHGMPAASSVAMIYQHVAATGGATADTDIFTVSAEKVWILLWAKLAITSNNTGNAAEYFLKFSDDTTLSVYSSALGSITKYVSDGGARRLDSTFAHEALLTLSAYDARSFKAIRLQGTGFGTVGYDVEVLCIEVNT